LAEFLDSFGGRRWGGLLGDERRGEHCAESREDETSEGRARGAHREVGSGMGEVYRIPDTRSLICLGVFLLAYL
jgi:hypothetical protein